MAFENHPSIKQARAFRKGSLFAQTDPLNGLRRPAPTKESDGSADAKPDRDQSQNVRATEPCKARVVETVEDKQDCKHQGAEEAEDRPLLTSCVVVHGKQAYHRAR